MFGRFFPHDFFNLKLFINIYFKKEKFEKLKAFRQEFPDRWPRCWGGEKELGVWCSFQRTQYKKYLKGEKNFLSDEKLALLKEINFCWVFEKK